MAKQEIIFTNSLSVREIHTLKRLDSVKQRQINILENLKKNHVLVARDSINGKMLLLVFYHVFESFVYCHSMIGRDRHKDLFFDHLFRITTSISPTYCIIFNSYVSLKAVKKSGAQKVSLINVEVIVDNFLEQINDLTGHNFHRNGEILMDYDDESPTENPIYWVNKEMYAAAKKQVN